MKPLFLALAFAFGAFYLGAATPAPKPAGNIGSVAVDAKWSEYASYLQRMIETIQIQWERIVLEAKVQPPSGSTVKVRFILKDDGAIGEIVDVDNRSTEDAKRACVSGITDRAPYGPWTDDMKAVLGDRQEMTFTFTYK